MPPKAANIARNLDSGGLREMINTVSSYALFGSYKLSIATLGLAFVLPFIYTVILDIYRRNLEPKDDEILADPVESVVPRFRSAAAFAPKKLRVTVRLLGRVFLIYPVGLASAFVWLAAIALLYWVYEAIASSVSTFAKLLFGT